MHDLVIANGFVIDGTGSPRRRADVGIDDGRIVALGEVGSGRQTIEAEGKVVSPGFVDVHTHLDVQGFWDPWLTPSSLHGVTTVIGGNCGFSVAPLSERPSRYLMEMLAKVEGMPLESLEHGVPWDWRSTADYFDRLDGRLALNAGFMVGHSAIRRVVMGDEATNRAATDAEIGQMEDFLRDGLAAGGMGFSSTWGPNHIDAEGQPVPSRHAEPSELIRLAAICGEYPGTSLEFVLGEASGEYTSVAIDMTIAMTVAAQRPLNWNYILADAASLSHWMRHLEMGDRAREAGGKIVGLVLPANDPTRFSFAWPLGLDSIPGWDVPLALPMNERLDLLRSEKGRLELSRLAQAALPTQSALVDWGKKVIVETFTKETAVYQGRVVADIAAERSTSSFDALLDIVCIDGLRTSFCNQERELTDADWEARASIWQDPRAVVGASDAGAHLGMTTTFDFTTALLEEGVRKRNLLSHEQAVRLLTDVPAQLYGLQGRGRLAEGFWADVVVYDPSEVGRGPAVTRADLPGGASRLWKDAFGIEHVLVNGVPIVRGTELTGALPGSLLRSGIDTRTPSMT
jgi:N-acyl-D-aspartate/D-glutamate deacylase